MLGGWLIGGFHREVLDVLRELNRRNIWPGSIPHVVPIDTLCARERKCECEVWMGWCECCGTYLEKGVRLDLLYSQAVALLATEFPYEVLRFSAHNNIIRELHRVLPIDNFPRIIEKLLWGGGRKRG